MNKHRTCDELGICQGLSPEQCPDCTSFECEVACSAEPKDGELYPWPRYPFAPGVIQGPKDANLISLGDDAALLTRRDNLVVMLLVLLMVMLGTLLGGVLAGYLHAPAWLYMGWLG